MSKKTLSNLFTKTEIDSLLIDNKKSSSYSAVISKIAIFLLPYLYSKESTSLLELKKYVYDKFGYRKKYQKRIKRNGAFEAKVARAVKLAILIENKNSGFMIDKDLSIKAYSGALFPTLKKYSKTRKSKIIDNRKNKSLIPVTIKQIDEKFNFFVLGQSKKSRKSIKK